MCGVELFDVASNCSMWRRIVRCGVELFDVGHRTAGGWVTPLLLEGHVQKGVQRTAKPCLDRLHFFAGDVESQARWTDPEDGQAYALAEVMMQHYMPTPAAA